jgi:hypothetical protein
MAVTSRAMPGATPNWYCDRCELAFSDPTNRAPCPRCQLDDALVSRGAPPLAQPTQGKAGLRWDRLPMWLIGSAILGWWWLVGGKYTVDGAPLLLNQMLHFLHLPLALAPITHGAWYLILAWLPCSISYVERRYAPWRQVAIDGTIFLIVAVWLIVAAGDGFSTYLAVTHPPADALALSRQVAQSPAAAAVWSFATTFLPEIGLALLWRWFRR